MAKITHEKFQEKLKELGADQIRTIRVSDRANGKNISVKRTCGEFIVAYTGTPTFVVRAEYQQGKVIGGIMSGGLGAIWLKETADIDGVIAMFEKVKTLKKFVGDES